MRWKLSGASTRNGITVIARGKVWMLMITWYQCKVQFDKAINTRQAVPSVVQRGWSDLWSEVKWCGNLKENKRKPTHLHIFSPGLLQYHCIYDNRYMKLLCITYIYFDIIWVFSLNIIHQASYLTFFLNPTMVLITFMSTLSNSVFLQ